MAVTALEGKNSHVRECNISVGNTGVQLTVGRYGVLVDVGCGLGS
jgi:hypothetical protein